MTKERDIVGLSRRRPPPARRRPLFRLLLLAGLLTGLFAPTAATAQDAVQGVQVRVLTTVDGAQQRVPDVGASLNDDAGVQVVAGVTDEQGEVLLEVAEPGEYTVVLDPETLPEGLVPRTGELESPPRRVQPNSTVTALFPLVEGDGSGAPQNPVTTGRGARTFADQLASVPQLFLDGIKLGSIIAITSIGLSLIFGTTGLVNFAHGELVTLGAVVAFYFNASSSGPRWHLITAGAIAVVVGAYSGAGLERTVWAPLRRRGIGLISMLVISIGLMFIARNVIQIMFGERTRPFRNYNVQSQISLFGVGITPRDLWIVVLSVLVLVGVGLMLQRTKIGKALRAVADNRDLAESSGIDVDRVIRFVWLLGGGLAAFGGVLLGATEQVKFDMGFNLLLLMFAGMILGGIGTAYGAMVGSMVVGVISQVSTAFFSTQLKFVWALLILIIVLLIKPQGLLGRAERFG